MMSEHNLKLDIEFESVKGTLKQIDALYDLLKKREHNISHQSLPTFEEHEIFVKSFPYKKWYLVTSQDGYIGSCYLDYNNSIGLNLIDESPEGVKATDPEAPLLLMTGPLTGTSAPRVLKRSATSLA